jgi:hypothetical protein
MRRPAAEREDEAIGCGATMSRAEIAEFAEFMLGRFTHLLRMAQVTDPITMAHYIVALGIDVRPTLNAVAASLEQEHTSAPN